LIRRMIILSALLLMAYGYLLYASMPEITPIRESLTHLPMQFGPWEGRNAEDFDSDILSVLGVDDYVNRIYYSSDRDVVSLYVGYYQSQRQGDTIHSPLNCLPGAGWNFTRRETVSIPVNSAVDIKINSIVIIKGMDKQVVLYWYQSHGRVVANEYMGKIYTVFDALRTNRTDAALVRVISPVRGLETASETLAEKRAIDFIKTLFPMLSRFLPA
jgi:EpsI family protein